MGKKKKLAAREAEIVAELERREEKKAAKRAAKQAAEDEAAPVVEAADSDIDAQIKARIEAKRSERAAAFVADLGGVTTTVEGLEAVIDPTAENLEKAKAAVSAARTAVEAVIETVETDHGREFVAGHGIDAAAQAAFDGATVNFLPTEVFAMPSEAPKTDFDTNGNNQYKVKRPSDGKVVGYTRATTYIANLEDRSTLEKWKLRLLLEGVGVHDDIRDLGADQPVPEPVAARMRDLIHRRDVAISKARKADRKGKLVPGELATYVDGAWSEFKKAVNDLAEELLDLGGANEKSQKGTDLHALCELYDREGIDAVGDLLTDGKITPADLADVEAYADAVRRAGIKFDLIEQPVVNDDLKVGGRLDRTGLVKLPGMSRSTRVVIDIKTGRVDLGAGKIAQQLEMYASSVAYDLDTDERTDMRLSRTKGVLIHLPAGTATCHIYVVDLGLGRKGNALSGQVRAWRNEGKRAIDMSVDLAAS